MREADYQRLIFLAASLLCEHYHGFTAAALVTISGVQNPARTMKRLRWHLGLSLPYENPGTNHSAGFYRWTPKDRAIVRRLEQAARMAVAQESA